GHQAEVERRVRLRVEVQDERPVPLRREGRGEVDRGGRLADAPLLVQDRDPSHRVTLPAGPLPYVDPLRRGSLRDRALCAKPNWRKRIDPQMTQMKEDEENN